MSDHHCQYHQFLTSKDNIHIRYAVFGDTTPTSHLIVFVLGRGEWIEKYLSVYAVIHQKLKHTLIILDHCGQGGSGGPPAHIDSYDDYVEPLHQLLTDVFARNTYSIIAHSMGGLISLYGTLKGELTPQKIVLSSPLIGLPQKPVPRILARILSQTADHWGLAQVRTHVKSEISYSFPKNRLTNDKEKYLANQNTPYPIPAPTLGWVHASFEATQFIHHDLPLSKLSTPLLIFSGGQEKVVSASSLSRWIKIARKLGQSTIECVHFPLAKHEIFLEVEDISQKALQKTTDFLSVAPS